MFHTVHSYEVMKSVFLFLRAISPSTRIPVCAVCLYDSRHLVLKET